MGPTTEQPAMILGAENLGDLINLSVLLALPGVLVLAWIVGRLLGVRRSWTTTVASGVLGWISGRRSPATRRCTSSSVTSACSAASC